MSRKSKPRPAARKPLSPPNEKNTIHIAIIEQNPSNWQLLSHYLKHEPSFIISTDHHSYESILTDTTPHDVIIFDFQRDSLTQGKEFVAQLKKMHPRTKSLIFSAMEAPYPILTLIKAGAFNFVSKNQGLDVLVRAIRDASLGRRPNRLPFNDFAYLFEGSEFFTRREAEIITAMARSGLTNDELADLFSIDPKTVKAHLSRSMTKTNTASRAQLILLALTFGLIPIEKIELPTSIHSHALDLIDE